MRWWGFFNWFILHTSKRSSCFCWLVFFFGAIWPTSWCAYAIVWRITIARVFFLCHWVMNTWEMFTNFQCPTCCYCCCKIRYMWCYACATKHLTSIDHFLNIRYLVTDNRNVSLLFFTKQLNNKTKQIYL